MAGKVSRETLLTRQEVQGNIDRIRTLLKEGNAEAAAELTGATEELFPKLSANAQRDMRKALDEALKTTADASSTDVTLFSTVDYRDAIRTAGEDPDTVVSAAATSLQDTLEAVGRAATKYMAFAEIMFAQYARFVHKGAPDIMANSQAARDFASDMQADARKRLESAGLDPVEAKRQVDAAWRDYKKRMSDYRARYAAELDAETFNEQYPMVAEAHPDASPAEALSLHYKLDLLGYSERQRRYAKISNLKGKLDGASKSERARIEKEIRDIQTSMGSTPEQQKAIDPVKSTRRTLKSIGSTVTELDPDTVRNLPASERRVIAQTVPTHLARLNAILLAAQDTDEE